MFIGFIKKLVIIFSVLAMIIIVIVFASVFVINKNIKNLNQALVNVSKDGAIINTENYIKPKVVNIIAVGDIMMHQSQLTSAYVDRVYDFSSYFTHIKKYLENGDIVIANLETPVAGSNLKYTGYPKFNAPDEILDELKKNNFTHLLLANNHALDRGWSGLIKTMDIAKEKGFSVLGAKKEVEEKNYEISIKNGMKIGIVNYTYGTNGLMLPPGKTHMLSYIDKNQIKKDLDDIKTEKVDAIIFAIYFGDEYKLQENDFQKDIVKFACDNGANVVLGGHPHVMEPIKFINKNCLAIYSLGNFVSGMTNVYTDLGGILKVEIEKDEKIEKEGLGGADGEPSLKITPIFTPTWVRYSKKEDGKKRYEILPLYENELLEQVPDIKLTEKELQRLVIYRDFVRESILPKDY